MRVQLSSPFDRGLKILCHKVTAKEAIQPFFNEKTHRFLLKLQDLRVDVALFLFLLRDQS